MKYVPIYALLLLSPLTYTHAQEGSLQGLITGIGGFINDVLIPFILGLAFLIFLINAVRFFVIGGDNTESQEHARSLALYGVGAFVLILSLWGLVNLLSNGIGLNEGPCIDGKTVQSDYIDRSAPCSSLVPRARPTTPPAMNVAPPASNVTPPISTNPVAPIGGGNSFSPDGNPIAYAPIQRAQEAVRAQIGDYFTGELPIAYGANAAVVERALFADFSTTPAKTLSETERLRAAYRLQQAGAISEKELNDYFNAVSEYQTTVKDPNTISRNAVSNIRVPLPASVTANINANRTAITKAIVDSNARNNMADPINTTQVINDIFDSARTTAQRRASFEALYDHPNNPLSSNTIRDAFISNYNTENAFNGEFTVEF
jgi:hypothetical protein